MIRRHSDDPAADTRKAALLERVPFLRGLSRIAADTIEAREERPCPGNVL